MYAHKVESAQNIACIDQNTRYKTVYQSENVGAKLYIINHTQYYGYLPQHTHIPFGDWQSQIDQFVQH